MKISKNEKGHWVIDFTCRGRRITRVIGPSKREAEARAEAIRCDILQKYPPKPRKHEFLGFFNKTDIYFIQSIMGGPIKIGKSANIEERLKELQIGNPSKLKIIKKIDNADYFTEKKLQERFKKYRVYGEWYSEEVLSLLNDF